MAQVTLDQKRLAALRRQLYGKDRSESKLAPSSKPVQKLQTNFTYSKETIGKENQQSSFYEDISFLRVDLTKILILATLAIGAQILLFWSNAIKELSSFWSLQMKLIHLGF